MRKIRLLTIMLLIGYIFEIIGTQIVFAAKNFELQSFSIIVNTGSAIAGNINANPSDILKIAVGGENKGDALTNLVSQFGFTNTNFTYYQPGTIDSYKWWSPDKSNISTSLFNPPSLNSCPVSNTSSNGDVHDLYYLQIQINPTFNAYSFNISNQFLADGYAGSNQITRTVYVNVKPHITDYYFEKLGATVTSIKNDGSDSIDLIVKVKDFNGCTNIDAATVRANLSQIGLTTTESLNYVSCDSGTKTATFKKSSITTLVGTGSLTFPYTYFSATDEDSYQNDPSDSRFNSIDKVTDLLLTVQLPGSPTVNLGTLTDSIIGSAAEASANITFSGNQNGTYKIVANGNNTCSAGTIISDWSAYTNGSNVTSTINATSLNVGSNTLYICIKNAGNQIGSANFNITKDIVAPAISIFTISPANVIGADSAINFECSENGFYKVCKGSSCTSTIADRTSLVAATPTNVTIPNAVLSLGSNSIYLWCKDSAGNIQETSGVVTKTLPTPSMQGGVTMFADNDPDYDGLDGRDFEVTWNTTSGTSFVSFESRRIYLLPSSTTLDTGVHNYVAIISDPATGSWNGTSSLNVDSAGNAFVDGAEYKAYVAIMGTSGVLGTPGVSSGAVVNSDVVQHPLITSAKFTSPTLLELTTNSTLDTNLASHNAGYISYNIGSTLFTGSAISSVSSTKLYVQIPNNSSISATGNTLVLLTGAIHSNGGGYNNYFNSGSLIITDGQAPTITSFTKTTSPLYGNYYNSNFGLSYTFGERMKAGGSTRFELIRTSGNNDATSHYITLENAGDLTPGAKTYNINLNTQSLVCGTTYQLRLNGQDMASNATATSYITGIIYDNCGPTAANLTDYSTFGTGNITLSWSASSDDAGFGAGVKNYKLKLYNGSSCSTLLSGYSGITATTKSINGLSNGTYSWNITPYDNLNTTGTVSSCDDFVIDNTVPVISSLALFNLTLNIGTAANDGDTIRLSANVTNTDSSHIHANLSALVGGGSTYNNVQCSSTSSPSISCNYAGGVVTYQFPASFGGSLVDGVKQVSLITTNTNGFNQQTSNTSITLDNTPPTIGANTITYPNGGESLGGTQTVTWNSAGISDSIGISYVKLEYSTGAHSVWHFLYSGANSGSYSWDLSSMQSRADYQVRLTAYDTVGNYASDTSNSDFIIDLNGPTVPSNTITFPNRGNILKGGSSQSITWNSAGITDLGGLATNPIDLYYSTDGGSNRTLIASGLPNNGSYLRTVPSINNTTLKIRLIAYDESGNNANDESDSNFIIDSTAPTLTMTYSTAGGATPPNSSKLSANNSFDASLTTSDSYLDKVYYKFKNTTNNQYRNSGSNNWTGTELWNLVCTDNVALGNGSNCGNISTGINATITNLSNYRLTFRVIDEAGNLFTGTNLDYVGDSIVPSSTILITSGSYISGTTLISGTGTDVGAGISQVLFQIQKGTDYWNGTSFAGSNYWLSTSTSNTYANWTYSFALPGADPDGQTYQIKSRIIDKSYKTGNESTTTKTVIKDSTAPIISGGTGLFASPSNASRHMGGGNISILWSGAQISDSTSGLRSNGIVLEYRNGTSWNTIANNEPNDGVYNWTNIPSIDYSLVKVRIKAYDNAGNYSTQESNSFVIDSTPPTIQNIETLENSITNGKINALKITMSEDIIDSTINLADFSISDGIGTPLSKETGATSNDNIFILNFAQTGSTGLTPQVSYIKGSLTDLVGKHLESVSNIVSQDKVGPRILNGGFYDNNQDGKIDQVKVFFSENLSNTTNTSAWTVNNPVAGSSLNTVAVSTNVANINLNQGGFDTSSGGMYIDFVTNANWTDGASNQAGSYSNLVLTDYAAPVLTNSEYLDTNSDYKLDTIKLYLSENVTGFNGADFSFNGFAAGSSLGAGNLSSSIITFAVNQTSADNDTNIALTSDFNSGNLKDFGNNLVSGFTSFPITDKISPKPLSYETIDSNGNGKIDKIKITYSENINQDYSSFVANVNTYSVVSYTGTSQYSYLNLTEKNNYDTDSTPSIQVISNSSLKDSNLNNVLTMGSSVPSQDKVGPVIAGARYDESLNKIYIVFSENIDTGTLDLANASNDFVVSNGGNLGTNSTVSITDNKNIVITLGNTASALTQGVSTIGIKTAAINDSNTNSSPTQGTQNQVVVSASVIINEVMWSMSGSQLHQYIELKNLSNTNADISNWIIENAGGNGVNLTIPAATILAGGSYYLIAKDTQTNSLLNIAPDRVDSTLSLFTGGQNNLVLKNGSLVQDSVVSTTWPAGQNSPIKSMERHDGCGDGTSASCWYTAQVSSGFDNTGIYGTPKSTNKFDDILPALSSTNIAQSALLPAGGFDLKFNYADNSTGVGINTTSANIVLSKWNTGTADWTVYTTTGVNLVSKSISTTLANYPIKNIPYGKYKAHFEISDLANNQLVYDLIFYVDNFTVSYQNSQMDLEDIIAESDFITGENIITIRTLGAGFELNGSKSAWNGPSTLLDRNSSYGFGIDVYKNENGVISNYDNTFTQLLNNTNFGTVANSVDTDGNLKTYIYKIKYKVKVDSLQPAGVYSNLISNSIKKSY